MKNMAVWCLKAILSGIIVFFFVYGGTRSDIVNVAGHNPDLWFTGSLMFVAILLIFDVNVFLHTKSISIMVFLAVWFGSFVAFVASSWVLDSIRVFKVYKIGREFAGSYLTYFLVFLVVGTVLLVDIMAITLEREFETPIYLLFKSLIRKKAIREEEKERMFNTLVKNYKAQGIIP
jgi:hypothetical protein